MGDADGQNIPPKLKPESWGLGKIPTGAKLFLILSGALLPLALVAAFAALQTTRLADQETRSRLRVAAAESSRALSIELTGDMNALRVALNALDDSPNDLASCARAQGVFAEQLSAGARFRIADKTGVVRCGSSAPLPIDASRLTGTSNPVAVIAPSRGLTLSITSPSGNLIATALFPIAFLNRIARPSGFTQPFGAEISNGDKALTLESLAGLGPLDRVEQMQVRLGLANLAMTMRVRSAPLTSTTLLATILPFLMWAAATSIAWFVVDRLLIRPLRQLRRTVAAYQPGSQIDLGVAHAMPAQEIRELGETFQAITRTVILHEAGLAEGLVRQTRLTREVHHRVKNNLQVISSLINFHARGARHPEAVAAYASIQRRVDALAVVHRNHYAELEENSGLSLRSIIGDLASNLRATVPDDQPAVAITLSLESWYANQDVATAIAFLITELIELAMMANPATTVAVSLSPGDAADRAILRVSSPSLVHDPLDGRDVADRYSRVLEGLARQLRSKLEVDPATGSYQIAVAITGRD
ncbi:MAG: sensor histidine kinase [Sphingomonas sp.]|nr:sensor histidine kinase [Sphingomonas sp.]